MNISKYAYLLKIDQSLTRLEVNSLISTCTYFFQNYLSHFLGISRSQEIILEVKPFNTLASDQVVYLSHPINLNTVANTEIFMESLSFRFPQLSFEIKRESGTTSIVYIVEKSISTIIFSGFAEEFRLFDFFLCLFTLKAKQPAT